MCYQDTILQGAHCFHRRLLQNVLYICVTALVMSAEGTLILIYFFNCVQTGTSHIYAKPHCSIALPLSLVISLVLENIQYFIV